MITADQAYQIATDFLKDYLAENPDIALIRERVEDAGDFYLVHYNTREAIADPENGYGLAGNWPIRVESSPERFVTPR